jgi:hypothetical protein
MPAMLAASELLKKAVNNGYFYFKHMFINNKN